FAGSHLVTSLLSFNIGVEIGQIFVLLLAIPALTLVFRHIVAERTGTIILSAFITHTAWHWLTDRWGVLRQYHIELNAGEVTVRLAPIVALVLLISLAWRLCRGGLMAIPEKSVAPATPETEQ